MTGLVYKPKESEKGFNEVYREKFKKRNQSQNFTIRSSKQNQANSVGPKEPRTLVPAHLTQSRIHGHPTHVQHPNAVQPVRIINRNLIPNNVSREPTKYSTPKAAGVDVDFVRSHKRGTVQPNGFIERKNKNC